MKVHEFYTEVNAKIEVSNFHLRKGQSAFITASELLAEAQDELYRKEIDSFNDDTKIEALVTWLVRNGYLEY